jgi:hypothetical protein
MTIAKPSYAGSNPVLASEIWLDRDAGSPPRDDSRDDSKATRTLAALVYAATDDGDWTHVAALAGDLADVAAGRVADADAWALVKLHATELAARRLSRAGNVVSLDGVRNRDRGGRP